MTVKQTKHFDIQRKIVSNMTRESWTNAPHVAFNYEPDVTAFMAKFRELSSNYTGGNKISVNTLMLKVVTEGLKKVPCMNAHIEFQSGLVRGKITEFKDINITMPLIMDDGRMMTMNLKNFDSKNLPQMTDYMNDVRRRLSNSNMDQAMYEVSLNDTLTALKQGKIKLTIMRLVGSKTGKYKIHTLHGKDLRTYRQKSKKDIITRHDIEQGTIMITNIGSTYTGQRGATTLVDIIPPQVCAVALGAIQDKPIVTTDENGKKDITIGTVMPMCIVFDHRALDFGDVAPFMKALDDIFENPDIISEWL